MRLFRLSSVGTPEKARSSMIGLDFIWFLQINSIMNFFLESSHQSLKDTVYIRLQPSEQRNLMVDSLTLKMMVINT